MNDNKTFGHSFIIRYKLQGVNTGWKVAEEFLSKVADVINKYVQNDNLKLLIDKPNKCTEYYTDRNTGWARGWGIRNFEIH